MQVCDKCSKTLVIKKKHHFDNQKATVSLSTIKTPTLYLNRHFCNSGAANFATTNGGTAVYKQLRDDYSTKALFSTTGAYCNTLTAEFKAVTKISKKK